MKLKPKPMMAQRSKSQCTSLRTSKQVTKSVLDGHNSKYSNLFNEDDKGKILQASFEGIIPQKSKFGITGYKHAKQGWLERPQQDIIDWKNVKIPAVGQGKRTMFDDIIQVNKKKLSP